MHRIVIAVIDKRTYFCGNKKMLLLKNGMMLTEAAVLAPRNVLISNGIIQAVREFIPVPAGMDTEVVDLGGMLLSYGFADLHVHFREPGAPQKETIRTGSLAAARGGYTTVCAMPNLDPAPDSPQTIAVEQTLIDRDACIEVLPYATITRGRRGLEPVDFEALKGRCVAFPTTAAASRRKR